MMFKPTLQVLKRALALGSTVCVLSLAQAAATDVSQTPLLTASGTPVKPNVLFILDDSGSMNETYLPEDASFSTSRYGASASQCNGLAYNPLNAYLPPLKADGTSDANANTDSVMKASDFVTSARSLSPTSLTIQTSGSITVDVQGSNPQDDWYAAGDKVTIYTSGGSTTWMVGTVNSWSKSSRDLKVDIWGASTTGTLTSAYVGKGHPPVVYYDYTGSQTRLGYAYDTSGNVNTGTTFYKECVSTVGNTPGSGVFTRKVVTSADAQKYANWYGYYRTRMLMMKTVVSQAFKNIDGKFRVGYNTILNLTTTESAGNTNFLHVRDFDEDQKAKFYSNLKGPKNSGYTPLRGALSNAGRYFAKKGPSQGTYDPVQYSCQKNFAILATDGAWNVNNETETYGPFKLNGDSVGQQDRTAARPLQDASKGGNSGGSSSSLADVAMYYYETDLRTANLGNCTGSAGVDVCENNVGVLGKDNANWQHLTTFTLSLGQNGTIKYDKNYETQTSGDFHDIRQNTRQWPNPGDGKGAPNVDDLWHAAVNGRGTYFNAADPDAVAQGLTDALTAISQRNAFGAAAATSTLRPVAGNNQIYVAQFTSALWTGDVSSYKTALDSGTPLIKDAAGNDIADWRASERMAARSTARKIYYRNGTTLREFTGANIVADGLAGTFENVCTKSPSLSQCAVMTPAEKTAANNVTNMVNYLRGTELSSVYRARSQILGDMVGSSPAFVGKSVMKYKDAGYAAFMGTTASRKNALYVGANDGMLHAYDAATGDELWAYIPTMAMPNMYRLADNNYASNHLYFVDGSPVVADVYIGGAWKTILICGLGAGGKGYFALDITDPLAPKFLWEFTDSNLGQSFAEPVITKRASGEWVIVIGSGYNNLGDGKGHLFVLKASDGTKVADISTTAGDTTTPSGLGPINAWIDDVTDNTAKRFYGGDLLGNLWRFDIDGITAPKNAALLLASFKKDGLPQPIATQPQLAEINYKGYKTAAVFVGTGKMLGLPDMTNTDKQSIYGIKDDLGSAGYGDVRAGSSLVGQTLSTEGELRTATKNPVDWSLKNGWYIDLPDSGERINVDMIMQFNVLTAASNVPRSAVSCTGGRGYSWLYSLDIATGGELEGSGSGGTKRRGVGTMIPDSLVVGLSPYLLASGKPGVIYTTDNGLDSKENISPPIMGKIGKRSSWRELIDR